MINKYGGCCAARDVIRKEIVYERERLTPVGVTRLRRSSPPWPAAGCWMPSWLAVHGTLTSDRGARDRRDQADRRSAERVTAHQSCATCQQRTAGGRDGGRDVKHGDGGACAPGGGVHYCAGAAAHRRGARERASFVAAAGGNGAMCWLTQGWVTDAAGRGREVGAAGDIGRASPKRTPALAADSTAAVPLAADPSARSQSVARCASVLGRHTGPPTKSLPIDVLCKYPPMQVDNRGRCEPSHASSVAVAVWVPPLQLHVSRAMRRLEHTERLPCSRRSGMLARCRKMRGGRACRKRRAEPFAGSIVSAVPYLDICFQVFWISGLKIQ